MIREAREVCAVRGAHKSFGVRKVRGAAFDIDGTLLDSTGIWDGLAGRYLASIGVRAGPDLAERLFTLTLDEGVAYMKERYGLSQSPEQMRQGISAILEGFYREEVHLKPGAREFVLGLREAGVRMLLTTAGDPALGRLALERLGVWDCFECLLSCDDYATTKAQPKIYRMAAEHLGLPAQDVLVVEDTLLALRCAHEAGFPTCAVQDEASAADQDAIRATVDVYLGSFQEGAAIVSAIGKNPRKGGTR